MYTLTSSPSYHHVWSCFISIDTKYNHPSLKSANTDHSPSVWKLLLFSSEDELRSFCWRATPKEDDDDDDGKDDEGDDDGDDFDDDDDDDGKDDDDG